MSEIISRNPATLAPSGGHYSHVLKAGGFVFVSGQLPIAADGTKLTGAPIERQVQQVLHNVSLALIDAGTSVSRLVRVRVYLTDIRFWPIFDTLYAEWAGASHPARTVVPVPQLHHDFLVEMEATALL